eukprot:664209_1
MADTVDVEEDMDVATMLPRVAVMILPIVLPYMMRVEEAVVVVDGTVDHIPETVDHIPETVDHTPAEYGIIAEIEDGTEDRIQDMEETMDGAEEDILVDMEETMDGAEEDILVDM